MSNMIRNSAKIREIYNLNGQKEYYLLIDCKNCNEKASDFFYNYECICCLFKNIFRIRRKNFKEVLIKSKNLTITKDQLKLLINYFRKVRTLKKYYKKIIDLKENKCIYKEFKCKIIPGLKTFKDDQFLEPLLFYYQIKKYREILNNKRIIDTICKNCVQKMKNEIEILLNLLDDISIIKFYNNFRSNDLNHKNLGIYYEKLFLNNKIFQDSKLNNYEEKTHNQGKIFKKYSLANPPLYQILIFEEIDEYEKRYEIRLNYNTKSEEIFFKNIIQDIIKNLESIKIDKIVSLSKLINIYIENAKNFLEIKYYKLSTEEKERLSFLSTLKKLNLEKLFPLLIDDYVEEIFLDSPFDNIYINHQMYGRCTTFLKLNMKELERIKTFLRIYSGQRLDYSNPSLKFVIKNEYFYCRFAIDVYPLQIDKFGLDIRKLNKNILSIQDLLKNRTLNPEIAAFLYFCVLKRINITVSGETDTGKTTLINALDLLTPKDFRKIYIENAVESLNQRQYGNHQLKYLVDSNENNKDLNQYSKSNQIKTLLHRSPDIIYLGEILTKEEAQAMFHCLASGLRGFQTIHSKSIQSLLNRFIYFFNIEPSCLRDLGIIIFMRKINYKRIVSSISEINTTNRLKIWHYIFQYSPKINDWIISEPLYSTNVIDNIRNFEFIKEEQFNNYLDIYKEIFMWLYKSDKLDVYQLVSFFHKISYYSTTSLNLLINFWKKWKQSYQ